MVLTAMGIDIWEVIDAASTKPFGFQAFYPGPGLGGHCIPIDPFYLTWKAREVGMATRFIELAGEINTTMPDYVVAAHWPAPSTTAASRSRAAKILVLGLAYKPDVDDVRESPSFELIEKLRHLGAVGGIQRSARSGHAPHAQSRFANAQRSPDAESLRPTIAS